MCVFDKLSAILSFTVASRGKKVDDPHRASIFETGEQQEKPDGSRSGYREVSHQHGGECRAAIMHKGAGSKKY